MKLNNNLKPTFSTLPLRVLVNSHLSTQPKAFTLVELIVTITILAILGTIGFVSSTGFMSTARDSNRLTQLEGIHNGLESYKTRGKLPLPDDSVTIYASGTIIGYQGNAGETVLNKIGYQKGGKDPLDDKYYTYYTDKKQQNIELLGFLENDPATSKETTFNRNYNRTEKGEGRTENLEKQELATILPPFVKAPLLSLGQTRSRVFSSLKPIPSVNATDYTERTITTFGKKLGILLDISNNPIQENTNLRTSGLDIVTTTGSYKAVFSSVNTATSSGIIVGTGMILSQSNPTASCKRILESGLGNTSGVYNINPLGIQFQVYCDMTTEGGGWTLLYYSKNNIIPTVINTNYGSPILYSDEYFRLSYDQYKSLILLKSSSEVAIEGYDISDNNKKRWEVGTFNLSDFDFSNVNSYFALTGPCSSKIKSPMYSIINGLKSSKGFWTTYFCHESSQFTTAQYGGLLNSRWYFNVNNKGVYVNNTADATKGAIFVR